MTLRWWHRVGAVALVIVAASTALVGVAAADATTAIPSSADASAPGTKWPAELLWAIPGTPAFTKAYTPSATASSKPPKGCGKGSNVYGYVSDIFRHAGEVFGAVAHTTGTGLIADPIDGSTTGGDAADPSKTGGGSPTMPFTWIGLDKVYTADQKTFWDAGSLGQWFNVTDPNNTATSPSQTPCAANFAPFGQIDGGSPFGFRFYNTPDLESVAEMKDPAKGQMNPAAQHSSDEFWSTGGMEAEYGFKVTDTQNYCTDPMNPWCATAFFLHCPKDDALPAPGGDAAKAAVKNCRIWNQNILMLNAALEGSVIASAQGHDASTAATSTWLWAMLIVGGHTVQDALAPIVKAWDATWGTLSCASDVGKCLAELAAKGMAGATNLVGVAASAAPTPSLGGMGPLFNSLAGISGIIMLILLFLTLVTAVLTGRMGLMIPATMGAVKWAMTMGVGATVLTMLFVLSGEVSDAIAGIKGTATGSINLFVKNLGDATVKLGSANTVAWLLIAIVCVIGLLASVVVYVVVTLSNQFIPLALALMLLQTAGFTGTEGTRKWIHRGWGILWMILLLRPIITLIAKIAAFTALQGTLGGFVGATFLLVVAAVAPWLVVEMFPVVASGGLGAMGKLFAAAQGAQAATSLAKGGGAALKAGMSKGQMLAQTLGMGGKGKSAEATSSPATGASLTGGNDSSKTGNQQKGAGKEGGTSGGGPSMSKSGGGAPPTGGPSTGQGGAAQSGTPTGSSGEQPTNPSENTAGGPGTLGQPSAGSAPTEVPVGANQPATSANGAAPEGAGAVGAGVPVAQPSSSSAQQNGKNGGAVAARPATSAGSAVPGGGRHQQNGTPAPANGGRPATPTATPSRTAPTAAAVPASLGQGAPAPTSARAPAASHSAGASSAAVAPVPSSPADPASAPPTPTPPSAPASSAPAPDAGTATPAERSSPASPVPQTPAPADPPEPNPPPQNWRRLQSNPNQPRNTNPGTDRKPHGNNT